MAANTMERRKMMESSMLSMNPGEQIAWAMDQALLNLEAARDLGKDADWQELRPHLMKAQKAVSWLLESLLAPDAPGADPAALAMAGRFKDLYMFVINQIIQADLRRQLPPLDALLQVMGDLAEGWKKGVLGRG
jgi:flagellin-specific chaperone FliS